MKGDIYFMANFTKKAICESFINLLNERPLKQITVKDIVDACGVNRNTFYYHFTDIPELIETIVKEDADRIMTSEKRVKSIEDCINAITEFAIKNKKAVFHIYRSVSRDIYEQYQWHICEYVANIFVYAMIEDNEISDTDKMVIVRYIKCICFGIIIDWLEGGMQDDIQFYVHRMCELKQGSIEDMISRCIIH